MKNIMIFDEISKDDIPSVGGKGANLGELAKAGFSVPPGFAVTVQAYYDFLKSNRIDYIIRELLTDLDLENTQKLNDASELIKHHILTSKIDAALEKEIKESYQALNRPKVAVRSSATAEDLPTASFAGQQATFLNISDEDSLIKAVKKCWASLFEPRAIYYRIVNKFEHNKVGLSVIVQKMIQSEVSGVMFTIDPATNDKHKIVIEAGYGLGEAIVSGAIIPDKYLVYKDELKILQKEIAKQTWMIKEISGVDKRVQVAKKNQEKQKLSDDQIIKLAQCGLKIEDHYNFPQDIEFAVAKGKIYFVQSRPITTLTNASIEREMVKAANHRLLLKGTAASLGCAAGRVKILSSPEEISKIQKGEILVAKMTNPSYVPAMKRAAAIITDQGGQTSHAAIVSRELGVPCIVGTGVATKKLSDNQIITVDADKGFVYEGDAVVKIRNPKSEIRNTTKTKTKLYVNLGEPELADQIAAKNVDGVGLLRAEFMIAEIGEHPRKMYEDKRAEEFITKLAEGIEKIAAAFYPRPVVYRATDFKTNEYKNLRGGEKFETDEANPMIGYRGALRYIMEPDLFKMELSALKKVRKKLDNVWLMIPFVRTVQELEKVKKLVENNGLKRSKNFKLWLMVEVPANYILIDEFCDVGIDGISIGSNDLTQLILGIDRDNEKIAYEFDERNEAVVKAIEKVIKVCRSCGVTTSVCGQAPSVYPEFAEMLVKAGITSVSVNPDVIDETREIIAKIEKK